MNNIEIEVYVTESGKSPYLKWVKSLTLFVRAMIHKRITRLEVGSFGDTKPIKGTNGLYELRIHEGPGYRIYFGKCRNILIILLCGGSKGTQTQDIAKAKKYWQDYMKNN